MIVTDEQAAKHCNGMEIRSELAAVLRLEGFHQHISLLGQILKHAHDQQPEVFFELARKFIQVAAPRARTQDELVSLSKLQTEISDGSEETELLEIIRNEAISYWMAEAHEMVAYEGILEHYIHDDEDEHAYDIVQNYIAALLDQFRVAEETLWEITNTVDLAQIKEELRESMAQDDAEAAHSRMIVFKSNAEMTDDAVDDLFERD